MKRLSYQILCTVCLLGIVCESKAQDRRPPTRREVASRTVVNLIRITSVSPGSIVTGLASTMTVEVVVTPSTSLVVDSVTLLRTDTPTATLIAIGKMFDDGTNGDRVANDRIYTCQFQLEEREIGVMGLQAAATYRGQAQSVYSTAYELLIREPSELSITVRQPVNGSSIADDRVTLIGDVMGPPNTGVTVNGVLATNTGTKFVVTIPLNSGENTIQVSANHPTIGSLVRSLKVTRTGEADVAIRANPVSGVAPVSIRYQILVRTGAAVTKIEADMDGDGKNDLTTQGVTSSFVWEFKKEGIYDSRFTLTRVGGAVMTKTLMIAVQAPREVDRAIREVWSGFTAALARKDIAAATRFFDPRAQARYQQIFEALGDDLPSVALSMPDLNSQNIGQRFSEYALINTNGNDGKEVHLVSFIRLADGSWRIYSM